MKLTRYAFLLLAFSSGVFAQTKTWQTYFYGGSQASPITLGVANITPSAAGATSSWTGALSSAQLSNFKVSGYGTDSEGYSYSLYAPGAGWTSSMPLGYVEQTAANGSSLYFVLNIRPQLLGVSPTGDVFIMGLDPSSIVTVYQLGSSGVLTSVFQIATTFFSVGNGAPGPLVVDENDDVSIAVDTLIGASDFVPGTYLLVTTGPVPHAVPLSSTYTSGATISVQVTASIPISYQWSENGSVITGATTSTYTPTTQGAYSVVASTSAGEVTLNTTVFAAPAVVPVPSAHLVNISCRANVGTGSDIAIAGFVVSGAAGSTTQVLIRAVGPTLSQFSVSGVLAQPTLTLVNAASGTQLATNTVWGSSLNSTDIANSFVPAGAFAFPTGSADSAILITLGPGAYTAEVSGVKNTTGIALIEAYEVPSGP